MRTQITVAAEHKVSVYTCDVCKAIVLEGYGPHCPKPDGTKPIQLRHHKLALDEKSPEDFVDICDPCLKKVVLKSLTHCM